MSENGLIEFRQINPELFARWDPCLCPFGVRACVKVWFSNAAFQGGSSSFEKLAHSLFSCIVLSLLWKVKIKKKMNFKKYD